MDLVHLEKMGRELKCPICLGLLKSAASLACNHIFCNSCIMESMKSVSNCPVCKVPFHRREVRAAPHMDNLTSVFKSMEVASGVNIFTTQVAPSTKIPDGHVQVNCEKAETPKTKVTQRRKLKGNRSAPKQKKQDRGHVRTLSKKRIHVTPCPLSETPIRPQKVSKSSIPSNEHENNNALDQNKVLSTDKQKDTLFSPLFWLRENGEDESLENLSVCQTQDASPTQNPPCFSDIKDSDDDAAPIKNTPMSKPNITEAFDSEIFEWTQRACSPELCLTPLKKQAAGRNRSTNMGSDNARVLKGTQSNVEETDRDIDSRRESRKKKMPCGRVRGKRAKGIMCQIDASPREEIIPEVWETPKNLNQENEDTEQNSTKGKKRRDAKISMKQFTDTALAETLEQLPIPSNIRDDTSQEQECARTVSAMLPLLEITNHESVQFQLKRKKTSSGVSIAKTVKEAIANPAIESKIKNQEHKQTSKMFRVLPSNNDENKESHCSGRHRRCKEIKKKSSIELKEQRPSRTCAVISKMSTSIEAPGPAKDATAIDPQNLDTSASKSRTSNKKFHHIAEGNVLRKCENILSLIRCAFCQSSDDTKVSGEMVHYSNGKLVTADYNKGANVIHSHRHCTEWAPDVYFEGDSAINLSAELARSRRIKCSCCGIKGAALGCYEKSCRRSFHYTCAKLTPECRWDKENFVVLCPLHLSSKLPNEGSEPRRHIKERVATKVESKGIDATGTWRWPSGSPSKWLLCCSALSIAEKEIVSVFARLTGVSISKTWNTAVTHVIASTDANGACKRTLKFLMGILNGKWILSIDWINACMKTMEPVDEEKFEITLDVHGIIGGPSLARWRIANKQPKMFDGFRFYFSGDFEPSYKRYLQDLIIAAGGAVLQRKPISRDQEKLLNDSRASETLILYSTELVDDLTVLSRRSEARALADACEGKVASSSQILDNIAACKIQLLL